MVKVEYDTRFKKRVQKIKDELVKKRVKKQIAKIVNDPEVGKPMRYTRKGTRELHIPPHRLSYLYLEEDDVVVLIDLYHKDEQ